jgi:hypothetical protein
MKKIVLGIITSFLLVSCSMFAEEIARIPFKQTSNTELNIKEITLELSKDDKIAIWTDTDIEYEGQLALVYTLELWQDSTNIGVIELNALETNPTLMEVKTSFGNKTSWSYQGKMNAITIDNDGTYTFKAILQSSDNKTLLLKKSDLVLKKE